MCLFNLEFPGSLRAPFELLRRAQSMTSCLGDVVLLQISDNAVCSARNRDSC
jgi:hypothetical protein